jgi:hypothetical protein
MTVIHGSFYRNEIFGQVNLHYRLILRSTAQSSVVRYILICVKHCYCYNESEKLWFHAWSLGHSCRLSPPAGGHTLESGHGQGWGVGGLQFRRQQIEWTTWRNKRTLSRTEASQLVLPSLTITSERYLRTNCQANTISINTKTKQLCSRRAQAIRVLKKWGSFYRALLASCVCLSFCLSVSRLQYIHQLLRALIDGVSWNSVWISCHCRLHFLV